jgi:hypothetical protein
MCGLVIGPGGLLECCCNKRPTPQIDTLKRAERLLREAEELLDSVVPTRRETLWKRNASDAVWKIKRIRETEVAEAISGLEARS